MEQITTLEFIRALMLGVPLLVMVLFIVFFGIKESREIKKELRAMERKKSRLNLIMGQEMTTFELFGAIALGLPFAVLGILLMIMSIKGYLERKELRAMERKGK